MYDIESIYCAENLADAIKTLVENPNAVIISGGSDVLVKIREGKLAGCQLVSIFGLKELGGITMEADGTIKIGPGCTFAQVTESDIVQKNIPALGFAVNQAGGPQLRNIGTIGGNVCNGVTSADSASTLLALNATLEITGSAGTRHEALETFYKGPGRVNLAHGEILTSILISKQNYAGFTGHYIKYAQRNAMDIATLGCAVQAKLSADKKTVEELRLAFGVAGPNPMRCPKTEAAAAGKPLNAALLRLLGETALTEVSPRTSWRATKEFRTQLVRELPGRALKQAAEYAGAEVMK